MSSVSLDMSLGRSASSLETQHRHGIRLFQHDEMPGIIDHRRRIWRVLEHGWRNTSIVTAHCN